MIAPLNLLVVEDHDDLREATVAALEAMGHRVRGVDCAEAMDEILPYYPADVLLLDLNLPGEDGLSIARRLRAAEPSIGIIMVTARNQAKDVMQGYGSGADIYVTKPISPEELHAAIQALTRRIRPQERAETPLALNMQTLQLTGPQGVVDLSNHECQLLAAINRAKDHRLETWQLLELLGKEVDDNEKRALTVQFVRLRKKLTEAGASEPSLKSIRGSGYQLCVAIEAVTSPGM
ncbi:MAG: transcriptional regulator [Betaproteobacteria bacterium HGW-Betaproteobacteria-10]|nr:MAG: transcriptional regulator [Betaproteobacteria bacterium HGW-Betaproteobacteria-10]